ncbi:T9SS type A sorting domain-containing protein, partial [Larkinella harenae]
YITTLNASVRLTQQNNYTAESLDAARFVNASGGDFRPVTGSPLIDAGQNASSYGVTVDLADQPRFKGRAFDIGAFEQDSPAQVARIGVDAEAMALAVVLKAYPSPTVDNLTVKLSNDERIAQVQILDINGRVLLSTQPSSPSSESTLAVRSLAPGFYMVQVHTTLNKKFTERFIKQ